jgi:hypothetical protein
MGDTQSDSQEIVKQRGEAQQTSLTPETGFRIISKLIERTKSTCREYLISKAESNWERRKKGG